MDRLPDSAVLAPARSRIGAVELDLFGEVPVSLDDVLLWMLAVPGLAPDSPRFAWYVRYYNVLDKIRCAKLEGRFESTISSAAPSRAHGRLSQVMAFAAKDIASS